MSKTSTNVFVVIFPSLLAMAVQRNKLYFQKVSNTNIIIHDVNKTSTKKKACKSRKVCVGPIGRTSIKNWNVASQETDQTEAACCVQIIVQNNTKQD
jgi:hypothetical protein